MALSESSRTRKNHPKSSTSSNPGDKSPRSTSPTAFRKLPVNASAPVGPSSLASVGSKGAVSAEVTTSKISLTKESSSVTSLPALKKDLKSSSRDEGFVFQVVFSLVHYVILCSSRSPDRHVRVFQTPSTASSKELRALND